MDYFALFYFVDEPGQDSCLPHHTEHLELIDEAQARGELLYGGVLAPDHTELLLFRANDGAVVEEFARRDPYIVTGSVKRWEIRHLDVYVAGTDGA